MDIDSKPDTYCIKTNYELEIFWEIDSGNKSALPNLVR
jgi:hypothetical protein